MIFVITSAKGRVQVLRPATIVVNELVFPKKRRAPQKTSRTYAKIDVPVKAQVFRLVMTAA
jgi:hypothetical protein